MKFNGRSDRVIAAGQNETLKVTIATRGRSGSFSRNIMVTTNDPANARVKLVCEAQVLAAVRKSPKSASFGRLDRKAGPKDKTISLTRGDAGPIKPELAGPIPKGVTASIEEIEAGERYALNVTVDAAQSNGPVKGNLKIRTGVAESPETSIRVYATVPARVEAVPRTFSVPRDKSVDQQVPVNFRWSDGRPDKLVAATPNDPNLEALVEEVDGRQRVVLRVPAGYRPTGGRHFVTVTTDDESFKSFQVPIRYAGIGRQFRPQPVTRKPGASKRRATVGAAATRSMTGRGASTKAGNAKQPAGQPSEKSPEPPASPSP